MGANDGGGDYRLLSNMDEDDLHDHEDRKVENPFRPRSSGVVTVSIALLAAVTTCCLGVSSLIFIYSLISNLR